ncbi:MAG: hypothetical protein Q4C98_06015 [Capnocytophaga sp.]|nr:hypothetical protein [Capnocytophaga sp.]
MNINDIETADIDVGKMEVSKNELSIYYDEVYFIPNKEYIKNIKIIIKDWEENIVTIYVSKDAFSQPQEVILKEQEIESFELIQEIVRQENDIILKGYSSISKNYMEYHIKKCDYEIIR